jgi:hypothetical protein
MILGVGRPACYSIEIAGYFGGGVVVGFAPWGAMHFTGQKSWLFPLRNWRE